MGLKDWFKLRLPSFAELRAANRSAAQTLTRAEAQARIENHPILNHPAAAEERKQILALLSGPFDRAAYARSQELLTAALQAQDYLLRPGTVEDVWILEGLFDRLLDLKPEDVV
ncbi:MAG: hypothetical protein JF614_14875 [Acidobacteria bacterium]|nr:hypothetical protein [Acidobacteriota bacterium]